MRRPRRWTPEDEEILRQLYLGRQPLERIAKRFDTTKDNIRQKAHRMGLKRPKPKDAPKHDMASRLRILQGKEVRPPTGRRLFSDEELLRFAGRGLRDGDPQSLRRRVEAYVLDPLPPLEPIGSKGGSSPSNTSNAWPRLRGLDLFCREVVGLELMDHQLAMALCCLASKRAVCLAGRQCGKDVTQAALALWEGVVQPNARIVVVSGAQRQSDALTEKALGFVARNEKLFDSVLRSSRETLELTNGSFIKALPATGLIRGETATRVLVNEARDILNEEETYAAVEPMLLTTNGFLGIFSTPLGKSGRLWEAFNNPLYLKTRIHSRVSKYATAQHLESQKLEMSAARYANEYEAEFLDVQNSFFSPESIQRSAREYDLTMQPEPGIEYGLGIDWARSRDTSVMMVVGRDDEDQLHVRYLKAFLNVPMPDQVAFVRHLHNVFRFDRIVSEYAGLGIGPSDQLQRDLGRTVDAFKPTTERKALGYDNLKSRLERGSITIPMHPKMLAELRTLEFRVTAGGHMTIHHPGGGSDDYADALMLACWPFRLREEDSRIRVIPRTRPFW
ncbi:MAG: terminase family protein [Thermoplasmata archaeon]